MHEMQLLYVIDWQSLVAIGEVSRQALKEDPNFFPISPMDYERYLVVSLGTGTEKQQPRYDAKMAAKWGVLGWLVTNGSAPLIEAFTQASADLVVFHNNVVFEALNSIDNYLRIQVWFFHLEHALITCTHYKKIVFIGRQR